MSRWVPWALALLVALGAAARMTRWANVFTETGVELLPADSHYYVRFAKLQLASFPHFTQFDPWVNFPDTPRIIWPPLHTMLVAAFVRAGELTGVGAETAAAWVDPVLSVLWLVGLGHLARRLNGEAVALSLVAVLALTPGSVWGTSLGNADHHVHEFFLPPLLLVLVLQLQRSKERRWAIITGVAAASARALTTTAGLFVPLLALVLLALVYLERERSWPGLVALTGLAFVASATVWALALGNLTVLEYEVLGGFAPLFGVACFSALAALAGRMVGEQRWLWALTATAPALALLAPELARIALHAGGRDPLLALVKESRPLLAEPRFALSLAGPLFPLAAWAFAVVLLTRQRSKAAGASPAEGSPLLLAFVFLGSMALAQARFFQLWTGVAAMLVGLAVTQLGHLDPRSPLRRIGVPGLAVLSLLWSATLLVPETARRPPSSALKPVLTWMRDHAPPAERGAVLSEYLYGHWINLWAERPAVSSTFSQLPWHVAANERAYEILRSGDEATGFARCRAAGVATVLATYGAGNLGAANVDEEPALLTRLRRPPSVRQGATVYPAHAHFRLMFEPIPSLQDPPGRVPPRVFEVVEGALVQGHCEPRSDVVLHGLGELDGRPTRFEALAPCSGDATFSMRLAQPGSYEVGEDAGVSLAVSLGDVRTGAMRSLPPAIGR